MSASSCELSVSHPSPLFRLAPALQDHVLGYVDMRNLQAFRAASPASDTLVSSHLRRYLDRAVQPFVSDASIFLHFLDTADAVISGSSAASVLLRTRWVGNDLDVYTPFHHHAAVVAFLIEHEGYTLHAPTATAYYGGDEPGPDLMASVSRLRRGDRRVDVIQSLSTSPLLPIAGFWCTALKNFVSLRWFCLAYPDLSEAGRALLSPIRLLQHRHLPPRMQSMIQKYERRGLEFRLSPLAWREETDDPRCGGFNSASCALTPRYFGDAWSVNGSVVTYAELASSHLGTGAHRDTVAWVRGGSSCDEFCGAATPFLAPAISTMTLVQHRTPS